MSRLHAEIVRSGASEPRRWALVLHGILGGGKNWLSFTRKLAVARPDVGFVLPDLRGHGRSHELTGPHDLEAVASDLEALETELGMGRFSTVIGHSFGGKAALVLGRRRALESVWVLDSNPGTRREQATTHTMQVLEVLESLGGPVTTRAEFTRALEDRGLASAIAAWLAMSLRPSSESGRYELGLDLSVVRALLDDFFRRDEWPELTRTDRETHLVVAGRSFVWQAEDLVTIDRLASTHPRLTVHRFEDAGHWVHVDAHDALLATLIDRL
ncbi:MAG: alpha/beta hydrolase [Deltaproteobacteria bacterium]|nr:alpha/beta hydrolase [Deltaproteobacteria bacterium]